MSSTSGCSYRVPCPAEIAGVDLIESLVVGGLRADDRRFTYVYEPETVLAGGLEFENWMALRQGRTEEVGKDKYVRWDLRQELESGVTDQYQVTLYLNQKAGSYRETGTGEDVTSFRFKGVSLENQYHFLNPAQHVVGFTGYLEGSYAGVHLDTAPTVKWEVTVPWAASTVWPRGCS